MCRFSKLGRSNAFRQTSHGNNARSPRDALDFGVDFRIGKIGSDSSESTLPLAIDDVLNESHDIDLFSSSVPEVGDIGKNTGDKSDLDRSKGESILILIIYELINDQS